MKKKIALLVPVIALCICGLFFYMNRNSDDIDVAFTVKNETKEKIDTVELKNRVKEIEKITSIPTFILRDNMEENKMFEVIIDYFGS